MVNLTHLLYNIEKLNVANKKTEFSRQGENSVFLLKTHSYLVTTF